MATEIAVAGPVPTRESSRRLQVVLWIAALLAIPAILMLYKSSDLPGADWLAETSSLAGLPGELHERLRHVLFIPLGALVVVLFRVTLGIRVLGPFRSILLAIALQITGVLPGLFFLVLVVAIVVASRPVLRALSVPYFGRVSITVSVVAAVMLLAILIGQSLGLEAPQRVVYFPVVVLCLTGEGFARTLRREGPRSALWRGSMTALAAVLITWTTHVPGVGTLLVRYPELLFAQIGTILVISEFLGFRLLTFLNPAPAKRARGASRAS